MGSEPFLRANKSTFMKASIDLIKISVWSRDRFVGKERLLFRFLLASSILSASNFILFCFSGILYVAKWLKYFKLLVSGGFYFERDSQHSNFELKWTEMWMRYTQISLLLRYVACHLCFFAVFRLKRNCVAIYAKHDHCLEIAG